MVRHNDDRWICCLNCLQMMEPPYVPDCLYTYVHLCVSPQRTWVTLAAFVWFFSTVCFQIACLRRGIITLITFVFIFPYSAFSNVSSNLLPEKKHIHIGCICLTFLHCAFSHDPSKHLYERKQSYIGCICITFLHYVSSNVSSNSLQEKMQSHIGCICLAFLHCEF